MKRPLLVLLLLITKLAFGRDLGADVYYKPVGGMKYEITVKRYRNCDFYPMFNGKLKIYNDSFELEIDPTFRKTESILNGNTCSGCYNNGNNGSLSVEVRYFIDTIDFSLAPYNAFGTSFFPKVYFAFSNCCRYYKVTVTGQDVTFIDAMLDLYYVRSTGNKIGFDGFANPIHPELLLNSTFSYSFKAQKRSNLDSIAYKMVPAKYNRYYDFSYNYLRPFLIYCPTKTQSCNANTKVNPVVGVYFNERNGNYICTPTKLDEYSVLICRADLYRNVNGKPTLLGYMKRDFQVHVQGKSYFIPSINSYKDYVVKARDSIVFDIPIVDSAGFSQLNSDTLEVELIGGKVNYGKVSLLDSHSLNKTIHFTWRPNDSDYVKGHTAEIGFRVFEKTCIKLNRYSLMTTFMVDVLPPDSVCNILVKTYNDKNRNGKRDLNEAYKSAPIYSISNNQYKALQTDSFGNLNYKPLYGCFEFGLRESPEIYFLNKGVNLCAKFDSTYVVELGFQTRTGLKGRVYEDRNGDCILDKFDRTLANQKVFLKDQNTYATTDADGYFYMYSKPGISVLECDTNSAYLAKCTKAYTVNLKQDSVAGNFVFLLQKKNQFNDLGMELNYVPLTAGSSIFNEKITLTNYGLADTSNFELRLIPSRKLETLKSNTVFVMSDDTIVFTIGLLKSGAKLAIEFNHAVYSDSFKSGENLCFNFILPTDDNVKNNTLESCRPILNGSSLPTLKTALRPANINEGSNSMSYRLSFVDSLNRYTRVLMKDSIDASLFDIRSFRVIDNPNNFKITLLDNVVFAEYIGSTDPKRSISFVFEVNFKDKIEHAFQINNSLDVSLNNDIKLLRSRVTNQAISAFKLSKLIDTVYCPLDFVFLEVKANVQLKSSNRYRVYLSDSMGHFSQEKLLLDTLCNSELSMLWLQLPYTISDGDFYKLRIKSTAPNMLNFSSEFPQTIQVQKKPSFVFTSNINKGVICYRDTLKLKVTGGDSFQFYYNKFPVANFSKKSFYNTVPQGNSFVSVRVKNTANCIAFSDVRVFAQRALPNLKLSSSINDFCAGDSTILFLNGANTYSLHRNNILWIRDTKNSSFFSGPLTNTTAFKLRGTDTFSCSNETSLAVNVNPLPAKPIITKINQGLFSSYTNGNQWYFNYGLIPNMKSYDYYPTENGVYSVMYTDAKACSAMSDTVVFVVPKQISINGNKHAAIAVYPNPANDYINANIPENAQYELINSNAQIVISGDLNAGVNTIDLNGINSGLFVLKIYLNGGIFYSKIHVLQ